MILWGAIQYPSWVGDNVQIGSNKPYLKSALVAMEQVIRIVLVFLLVGRFQVNALIFAYFAVLGTKDLWDDATLKELHHTALLSDFMRPLAWLFWKCNALGAGISPLHNRFPITIRAAAMKEAAVLTRSRAKISDGEAPAAVTLVTYTEPAN